MQAESIELFRKWMYDLQISALMNKIFKFVANKNFKIYALRCVQN